MSLDPPWPPASSHTQPQVGSHCAEARWICWFCLDVTETSTAASLLSDSSRNPVLKVHFLPYIRSLQSLLHSPTPPSSQRPGSWHPVLKLPLHSLLEMAITTLILCCRILTKILILSIAEQRHVGKGVFGLRTKHGSQVWDSWLPYCRQLWWAPPVAQMVKNLSATQKTQETGVHSLGQEDLLEKEMAIHSRILTWEIP